MLFVSSYSDLHVCIFTIVIRLISVNLELLDNKRSQDHVLSLHLCSHNSVEHKDQREEKLRIFSVSCIFTMMTSR